MWFSPTRPGFKSRRGKLFCMQSNSRHKKGNDLRGNRTPNLRVWNPTRCHCAMKSYLTCGSRQLEDDIRWRACISGSAVLAERLRRTLKARVRKSVGSIPTDCNNTTFFACSLAFRLILFGRERSRTHTSAYSSVGRAGDCRWLQLISLGHWFDSGCADNLFFSLLDSIQIPREADYGPPGPAGQS